MSKILNNIKTLNKIKTKTKTPNSKLTNQESNTLSQTRACTSITPNLLHKDEKTLREIDFVCIFVSSSEDRVNKIEISFREIASRTK